MDWEELSGRKTPGKTIRTKKVDRSKPKSLKEDHNLMIQVGSGLKVVTG